MTKKRIGARKCSNLCGHSEEEKKAHRAAENRSCGGLEGPGEPQLSVIGFERQPKKNFSSLTKEEKAAHRRVTVRRSRDKKKAWLKMDRKEKEMFHTPEEFDIKDTC